MLGLRAMEEKTNFPMLSIGFGRTNKEPKGGSDFFFRFSFFIILFHVPTRVKMQHTDGLHWSPFKIGKKQNATQYFF